MNLESTAVTLAEQFGTGHDSGRPIDRFFENLGKFAFGGLGTVLAIGIGFLLYYIFTQILLEGSRAAFGVFLMLLVVFASLALVYVFYNESRKDKMKAVRAGASELQATPELAAPDTGKLLNEPSQTPIPGVTEGTTDLLKVEAGTRKLK